MPNNPSKFIQMDEEGYFHFDGLRVSDPAAGQELLQNLWKDDYYRFQTRSGGHAAFVEVFDEPYMVQQVHRKPGKTWTLQLPYQFQIDFDVHTLSLDEWDRFHGRAEDGIPFVLTRKAQADLFNLVDAFDDESVTVEGERIEVDHWLTPNEETKTSEFWTNKYEDFEGTPPWELQQPAPALKDILPQIKISKGRIAVLGAGSCNDAAFLAKAGHLVTAVDMSPYAIEAAHKNYGHLKNLTILEQDIFNLGEKHFGQYDLVFEHTCYCAVDPKRRNELVKLWKKLLGEKGHLLGVFFTMDLPDGPPWGGSEWEIRERLKKDFDFLYWTRWQHSLPKRQGKELAVYAQLKSNNHS